MPSHTLLQGFMFFFWAFFTRSRKSDLSYWLLIAPFYIDHAGMTISTEGPEIFSLSIESALVWDTDSSD